MNNEIRRQIDERLKEKGMSRADLARAVQRTPQTISRALNDSGKGAGAVPDLWRDILDALDLELSAQPKGKG